MKRVLIFGNRRDSTQRLAEALRRARFNCGLLSGAVDQKKRLQILDDFKHGRVPILVATDVAGRGIHVDDVTHVINFDFPYEADDYVHRIGRTGRAGAEGTAISFACEDESFIIPDIEKYIGRTLPCRQPDEHLRTPLPDDVSRAVSAGARDSRGRERPSSGSRGGRSRGGPSRRGSRRPRR
jgi:ATP-dependent RNA helicase RhlB